MGSMQRLATILCAVSVLVLANGVRGVTPSVHSHGGSNHVHHDHAHNHDGESHVHSHGHGHAEDGNAGRGDSGPGDHSQPGTDSHHHDGIDEHGHDDLPFSSPLARIARRGSRDSSEMIQVSHLGSPSLEIDSALLLPPMPPPKPPLGLSLDAGNLPRLCTIILLT